MGLVKILYFSGHVGQDFFRPVFLLWFYIHNRKYATRKNTGADAPLGMQSQSHLDLLVLIILIDIILHCMNKQ